MNILFLEWKSYCVPDMMEAFQEAGHQVTLISCEEMTNRDSKDFHQSFLKMIDNKNYDFVFTFNYFPIVSKSCNELNLPYVSWIYDNPLLTLYSYTVIYPCNYIFLFDYKIYNQLHSQGISTVYYLPLCANPKRLCSGKLIPGHASDVSFVGSLYSEPRQRLYDRLGNLDTYTRGYLDAIIMAQSRISGYFFLEELLTKDVLDSLQKAYPISSNPDGVETPAYVYAQYFLGRKATAIERHDILAAVSEHFPVKLYTHERPDDLPSISFAGKVDYYDAMPSVFRQSKINLNITLKTIETGIPLRAWDILGCGGFLLSNFQEEYCSYFVPGEDFVYYESIEDAVNKVDYYLTHEKDRLEIAHNGLEKIKSSHTFHHRLEKIFETINL